jgi:hypothetical protein
MTSLSNIEFSHQDGSRSETVGSILAAINAGAAVQWFAWKSMFIEAGLEYTQFLTSQSPAPGFLRTHIALGRRF